MAGYVRTKDGLQHYLFNDSNFRELIRDYMGNDAADYYEQRLHDFDNVSDLIDKHFPPSVTTLAEVNEALDKLNNDEWRELFWSLRELRGWDQ